MPNFGSLSWFWSCKKHQCPLSPDLGLWRMLEVPDKGLASGSWFWYGHWSLIQPHSKFRLSILVLKMQRTSMSFKSCFSAVEVAVGSWLGFGMLILIWICSLVFDTCIIQILALYLDFDCAKNIHVLWFLIWCFWGCRRFVTGVWPFYLDLDIITGVWYNYVLIFGSSFWFWRCK